MMRIAALADTHWKGDDAVPEVVLEQLEGVDIVLHAGDIKCEKVMKALSANDRQVFAVRGNTSNWTWPTCPTVGWSRSTGLTWVLYTTSVPSKLSRLANVIRKSFSASRSRWSFSARLITRSLTISRVFRSSIQGVPPISITGVSRALWQSWK